MQNNEPKFEILHMPPENTNSLLVSVGDAAVIFDPWGRAADWEKLLNDRHLNLRAIYATHGHTDHISAAPELAEKYNVPWYMNSGDNDLVLWGNPLLDFFEMPHIPDNYRRATDVVAGETEILPGVNMTAIATPGHSAGGMAYLFPDFGILLTGDTLFRDSVGRYDFPGADADALRASIARLYDLNLPDETYVVHGHGVDSTIGLLKTQNPYFKPAEHCCCGHGHGNCCCNHGNGDCCGKHHDGPHHCCGGAHDGCKCHCDGDN